MSTNDELDGRKGDVISHIQIFIKLYRISLIHYYYYRVIPAGNTHRYYILEDYGKRKDRKMQKKWWVLGQSPYSLQGMGRQSPRMENAEIDHPTLRITQRASIIKVWEDK